VNAIDIGILVIVGLFAIDGLRRGFLLGLLDLVALVLAIVIGGQFAVSLGEQLQRFGLSPQLANSVGFVIAAVVSLAVIGLVGRILLSPIRALRSDTPFAWANNVLGILPGALRGLALAALLVSALLWLPTALGQPLPIAISPYAQSIAVTGRDALTAGLQWARIDPAQIFSPGLPPREPSEPGAPTPTPPATREVTAVESDPAGEESLLAMINSDRETSGLVSLRADSALAAVARTRAQELVEAGDAAATPPASGNLSAELAANGVNTPLIAENRTTAATVEKAHATFIRTPADRTNVFNAGFTRVGIAVLRRADNNLAVVEVFAGP
jgi:uncharacterized membrane protein required for colicin V production/uncharacterized protein YkwD